MRALHYLGPGQVEWRQTVEPTIEEPGDALIRPIAVTTCDLDQALLRRSLPGADRPFVLGHEGVGEVVAIGSAVTRVRPGDTVAIAYHSACGACDRCRRNLPLWCHANDELTVFGIPVGPDLGGLFADLVRVPFADTGLFRLPPNVDPVDAVSTGDNLSDAWRAVAPHVADAPGADVLVVSSGSMGLYAVDVARACGARKVVYVDREQDRLDIAEQLGAEAIELDAFLESGVRTRFALTVNAGDSRRGLTAAILATEPGGRCESGAFHFSDVPMPLLHMHLHGITFRSTLSNASVHMPDVLAALASGRLHPELVRTGIHRFEDLDQLPQLGWKPVLTREP